MLITERNCKNLSPKTQWLQFDDSMMTMMQINLSLKTQWEVDEVNYVQSEAL